jgi:DNA-binding MarR family transcriptional regulator
MAGIARKLGVGTSAIAAAKKNSLTNLPQTAHSKKIADHLKIHYTTVSKIIAKTAV